VHPTPPEVALQLAMRGRQRLRQSGSQQTDDLTVRFGDQRKRGAVRHQLRVYLLDPPDQIIRLGYLTGVRVDAGEETATVEPQTCPVSRVLSPDIAYQN
jgi:hypothetical protein